MVGRIIDYVASYRDNHISEDKFREDLSNPDLFCQEDLADFILDAFNRRCLVGVPESWYYDVIRTQKKPAVVRLWQ